VNIHNAFCACRKIKPKLQQKLTLFILEIEFFNNALFIQKAKAIFIIKDLKSCLNAKKITVVINFQKK